MYSGAGYKVIFGKGTVLSVKPSEYADVSISQRKKTIDLGEDKAIDVLMCKEPQAIICQ